MKRKKATPLIDLNAIINAPVLVRVNGEVKTLSPYEAEMERCAIKALEGNIAACRRFITECIGCNIVEKPKIIDDWPYVLRVPRDWYYDEFMAKFDRLGFPPWRGKRDGLTAKAREELKLERRRSHR